MDEEGIQSISDGAWVPGDLTSLVLLRVGLGREWRLQDGNPGLMLEETAVFNDVELRAVEATLEAFDPVVRTDEGADEPELSDVQLVNQPRGLAGKGLSDGGLERKRMDGVRNGRKHGSGVGHGWFSGLTGF